MPGSKHKSNLGAIPGRPEAILHDLRNLLMAAGPLAARTERALKGGQPHQASEHLGQLQSLVRDALSLAGIDRAASCRRALAPAPYIAEHVAAFAGLFDRTERFSLTLRPSCASVQIGMQPIPLLRVLTNLVRNAEKASQKGGRVELVMEVVTLDASQAPPTCAESEGQADFVSFQVQDRGPGFAPVSVAAPHSANGGRRSLGLQVSSELLKEAGGFLRVHSRTGGGTTVEALVPALG